mmetsp:Transcript_56379/g.129057  ORF Transcript_56379/g.129057 Transcript_56379/m.129057 type:complete len:303 (-) Transcript_56379:625-1533(-)
MFSVSNARSVLRAPSTNPPAAPAPSRLRSLERSVSTKAATRARSWPTSVPATKVATLRTAVMRSPNCNEHAVSSACSGSLATLMTTQVKQPALQSDSKLLRSSIVRVESRYGRCSPPPPPPPRPRITRPSTVSELLIWVASARRCPLTPLFCVRSEPARSTKRNCFCTSRPPPRPPPLATCSRNRQCERDERSLSLWLCAERDASTWRASLATSFGAAIGHSVSPTVAKDPTSFSALFFLPAAGSDEAGDGDPLFAARADLASSWALKQRRQEQALGCLPLSPVAAPPSPSAWPLKTAATSD